MTRSRAQITPRRLPDTAWKQHAACRDEDLTVFFGTAGEQKNSREARERRATIYCTDCPVRDECLEHALAVPEKHGVWGGMGEDEREAERRRRRRRTAA